jgi:hypothetical protein
LSEPGFGEILGIRRKRDVEILLILRFGDIEIKR